MPRVKRSVTARSRHKKVLKKTKGFKHGRKNIYRQAKQALIRAKEHLYRSRRLKKRNMRALNIVRINAACQKNGIRYSEFIAKLNEKKISYSRRELAEMAASNPKKFEELIKKS